MDKNLLLQKLPPFRNNQKVIMKNQNVGDIINGILDTQEKYKSQYDRISPYFLGRDLEETCYNIWVFLKDNVPYQIESDNLQTLRSPASIVSGLPADCKTFSLFSMGIVSSLVRKELIKCKLAYRFAGYNSFSDNLEHVFVVVNPKTNKEIWIDAVLPNFDQKKEPSIFKDKNINNMALVALSGIGDIFEDINSFSSTASSFTNPVSAGLKAIETLSSLFANKPSPNDWVGWDAQDRQNNQWDGSSVRGYVLNDGDSVQNEALNIVSYIKSKGIDKLINSGHPVTVQGTGWRDVTIDEIVAKLARGGYGQEATNIKNAYFFALNSRPAQNDTYTQPKPPIVSPSAPIPLGPALPSDMTSKAGINIWLIVALAGAAVYAISKKSN
jgi:hypothetical protein